MWAEKPTDKEGLVWEKNGKPKLGRNKWKCKHMKLVQGHLLLFKRIEDEEPARVYFLKECEIVKEFGGNTKKEFSFGIRTPTATRLFAVESKDCYDEWFRFIEAAIQPSVPLPDDASPDRRKRVSVMQKAKKNIAGKVVSSSLGRDALKSVLDEEMRDNFALFKELLVSEFGEEKAEVLEKDIVKLIVKAHFAYENRSLESEHQQALQSLTRKCCYLLTGAYGMQLEDKKKQVLERAANVITDAQGVVEKAMKPALTPKNFARIATVFTSIGSTTFLINAYTLEKNKTIVCGLHDAMQKFLAER